MLRSERYLIVAAALLLAVGVASLVGFDRVPSAGRPSPPAYPALASSSPELVPPPVASVASAATAPSLIEPWSLDETMSAVATRFRDSKDLRAFYDRALEAGGSAHLWFAERALSRCQGVAFRGRVAAEQTFNSSPWWGEQTAERQAAFRAWIEPCAGFETRPVNFGIEMQRVVGLMRKAPGPIGDRWRPPKSADGGSSLVREAITSGDPEVAAAIMDVAVRIGVPVPSSSGSPADGTAYIKRYFSESQSWELALCDLGRDCGKGTQTWFTACLSNGDCAEGNYRQGYVGPFTHITKDDLPEILKRRDAISAALRARDWAALGLAP